MNNFDYVNKTRLVFGKGEENNVGALLKEYRANKILLHYGKNSIKKSGLYDKVIASLNKANIAFVELGGVEANPKLGLARQGVKIAREERVDFILAVGGGSVIDSAKAIAAGVYYEGDVWDLYKYKAPVDKALSIATILTLPAAGSESSDSTVLTNENDMRKQSFGTELIRPVFSIINPEIFFTLPKSQIANGLTDMLCHVMERYFTNTDNVQLTDGLCESVMKTIMRIGVKLIDNPTDYDLWAEIAFAGTVAHNGLIGMGRVEDWASHDIEHELSAIYDIAHGAGLAIINPAWIKYVYKHNMPMFMQWAVNVMGVRADMKNPDGMIQEGIEKLENFYKRIGQAVRLSEIGISDENFDLMATKATNLDWTESKFIGGFKLLGKDDIKVIYELAK